SLQRLSLQTHRAEDEFIARMISPLKELRQIKIGSSAGPQTLVALSTLPRLNSLETGWATGVSARDLNTLLQTGRIHELRVPGVRNELPKTWWRDVLK